MQNESEILPGYIVYDYLLAIQPHEELCNRILNVRKELAEKFDTKAAFGKPQIDVVKFSQLRLMEERIVNRLKVIATALPAFKVELKDFGSLPTHTIFINVDTKVALQGLVKSLRSAQTVMKTEEQKPRFIENTFIPIATKLSPEQFEKAWLEYSHTNFSGRFIADKIVLLRRKQGEKQYETVQEFQFLNTPVHATQASLF